MAIEISTAEQFMAIKDWTDRGTADAPLEIVITQDLDFSEIDNFEGLGETPFYANLDGQGHVIKNIVTYYNGSGSFVVLGRCYGNVKNITIDNCHITLNISHYDEFYWLYGDSSYTTLENITVKNTNRVISNSYIRFFWGYKMANCISVRGTYQTTDNSYGTINPFNGTLIKNSHTICTLICNDGTGFLYGSGQAYNCFARNKLTVNSFCGFSSYSRDNTKYCYAANTNEQDIPGSFYGFASFASSTSYFDKDIITISTVPKDLDLNGQPTENLKSVEWLRSQGWAI